MSVGFSLKNPKACIDPSPFIIVIVFIVNVVVSVIIEEDFMFIIIIETTTTMPQNKPNTDIGIIYYKV